MLLPLVEYVGFGQVFGLGEPNPVTHPIGNEKYEIGKVCYSGYMFLCNAGLLLLL